MQDAETVLGVIRERGRRGLPLERLYLIGGQHNPKALAQLARGRMRTKIGLLEEALTGFFTAHHGFLLAVAL